MYDPCVLGGFLKDTKEVILGSARNVSRQFEINYT